MIITSKMIKQNLNLSNKDMKIVRDVKEGKLFKLKNGLYETDASTPGYLLAGSIYGPSYLSFDFALAYYGMIPERVVNYTSATYNKKRTKKYTTYFGTFFYQDVPKAVYSKDINLIMENGYTYQIASKEKALCDKLYSISPVKNKKEMEHLLFKDLRIDEEIFEQLDIDKIVKLSTLYHSTNVNLLVKYMKGNDHNE